MQNTLGDFVIQVEQWDDPHQMQAFLSQIDKPVIRLPSEVRGNPICFSITVSRLEEEYLLTACTDDIGLQPGMLVNLRDRALFIGYGDVVILFSLVRQQIMAEHHFPGSCFYRFFTLHHVGITDYFLVWTEISIAALSFRGQKRWQYDSNEIISAVEIHQKEASVLLFDSNTKFMLSLATGEVVV